MNNSCSIQSAFITLSWWNSYQLLYQFLLTHGCFHVIHTFKNYRSFAFSLVKWKKYSWIPEKVNELTHSTSTYAGLAVGLRRYDTMRCTKMGFLLENGWIVLQSMCYCAIFPNAISYMVTKQKHKYLIIGASIRRSLVLFSILKSKSYRVWQQKGWYKFETLKYF